MPFRILQKNIKKLLTKKAIHVSDCVYFPLGYKADALPVNDGFKKPDKVS